MNYVTAFASLLVHFPFFCQFFLKATQLEQMSTDYELIIEQQEIIKNTLERKQEVCRHHLTSKVSVKTLYLTDYLLRNQQTKRREERELARICKYLLVQGANDPQRSANRTGHSSSVVKPKSPVNPLWATPLVTYCQRTNSWLNCFKI